MCRPTSTIAVGLAWADGEVLEVHPSSRLGLGQSAGERPGDDAGGLGQAGQKISRRAGLQGVGKNWLRCDMRVEPSAVRCGAVLW